MFLGSSELLGVRQLWKIKAPSEHKFFAWLVLQDRCWTSDRHQRHGLQADSTCALCDQNPEYVRHLLLGCVYSREVWASILQSYGWEQLVLMPDSSFTDWWLALRKRVTKWRRKAFDSIVLVSRCIWLQWDYCVFDHQSTLPPALVPLRVANARTGTTPGCYLGLN
jgi:hypothetical protein